MVLRLITFLTFCLSTSKAYSITYNFNCRYTTETPSELENFPPNQQVEIPHTLNSETGAVTLDLSNVLTLMSDDTGYRCMKYDLQNLTDQLISICEETSEEIFPECQSSVFQQRAPILDQIGLARNAPLIIPGEYIHGADLESTARGLMAGCGGSSATYEMLSINFIQNELPRILETSSPECRQNIVNFIEELFQGKETEAQNNLTSQNPIKRETAERTMRGLNRASQALYEVLLNQGHTFGLNTAVISCISEREPTIENFYNFVTDITDQMNCLPFTPGEPRNRQVNIAGESSPSGLEHLYNINYDGRGFELEVNLSFYAISPDEPNPERFEEITRTCLAQANEFIQGPNGAPLSINLYEGDPSSPEAPALKTISINDSGHRSNSNSWSRDIENSCPTIIHEILHVMGLCDEYPESQIGYVVNPETGERTRTETGAEYTAFDCRALGPEDSIMRSQWAAFDRVNGPETKYLAYVCPRGTSEETCRKSEPQTVSEFIRNEMYRSTLDPDSRQVIFFDPLEDPERPRPSSNLLSPTHLNAILFPDCHRINGDYYRCAQGAYLTSSEVSGIPGQSCPEVPESCRSGNTDWIHQ